MGELPPSPVSRDNRFASAGSCGLCRVLHSDRNHGFPTRSNLLGFVTLRRTLRHGGMHQMCVYRSNMDMARIALFGGRRKVLPWSSKSGRGGDVNPYDFRRQEFLWIQCKWPICEQYWPETGIAKQELTSVHQNQALSTGSKRKPATQYINAKTRILTSTADPHPQLLPADPGPGSSLYHALPSDPLRQLEQEVVALDRRLGLRTLRRGSRAPYRLRPFRLRLLHPFPLGHLAVVAETAFDPSSLLAAFGASSSFAAAS